MRWTCTDPIFRFFKGLEQVPEASVGEFTRHARKMAQYCQETMKRGGLRQYSLKKIIEPYGVQMWVNVIDNGLGFPLITGHIQLANVKPVVYKEECPCGLFFFSDIVEEKNYVINFSNGSWSVSGMPKHCVPSDFQPSLPTTFEGCEWTADSANFCAQWTGKTPEKILATNQDRTKIYGFKGELLIDLESRINDLCFFDGGTTIVANMGYNEFLFISPPYRQEDVSVVELGLPGPEEITVYDVQGHFNASGTEFIMAITHSPNDPDATQVQVLLCTLSESSVSYTEIIDRAQYTSSIDRDLIIGIEDVRPWTHYLDTSYTNIPQSSAGFQGDESFTFLLSEANITKTIDDYNYDNRVYDKEFNTTALLEYEFPGIGTLTAATTLGDLGYSIDETTTYEYVGGMPIWYYHCINRTLLETGMSRFDVNYLSIATGWYSVREEFRIITNPTEECGISGNEYIITGVTTVYRNQTVVDSWESSGAPLIWGLAYLMQQDLGVIIYSHGCNDINFPELDSPKIMYAWNGDDLQDITHLIPDIDAVGELRPLRAAPC